MQTARPTLFRPRRRLLRTAVAAAWLAGLALPALAERPLTLVTAFPPGGGADVVARLLAPRLAAALGQPVVVDNRPGASGNLATDLVVRAPADGSVLLVHNNTLTINAALSPRPGLDPRRDLAPLAAVAATPIVVAVHPALPVKTLAELVDYGRRHPGQLSYASCGNGTAQHFAGVQFSQRSGVAMAHIPYKGCAPAVVDGIGGVVPVLFNTMPNLDAQVRAGKLRYLAVAAPARLAQRPELATVAQTPGLEGFAASVWFGVFAPARTPPAVRERLERALLAAMDQPALQAEFDARLLTRQVMDARTLARQVEDDLAGFQRLAAQFQIVPD
ncbi:tripartite tricarboxylate transporter substrate-binding protein [Pseudorhodoferax sp.]|uniref:tripartite tricarboxylate transporter substrate-binding protein n=1 Tax=Pseudorhodoferax sp. TaxID=1993553 RepID=UPI002DD6A926|nr:tripartite tricarboxylate transporter substrate-binding protein [Pseudorhodoferax sp.]